MRRLIAAALLLYPPAVRRGHGEEIESLVTELIEHEGHSRPAVIGRLAVDGLVQRLTSRATAWVLAITLALTSFGGLAVSDFAAASAHQPSAGLARATRAEAAGPAGVTRSTVDARMRRVRAHRTGVRSAGIIAP